VRFAVHLFVNIVSGLQHIFEEVGKGIMTRAVSRMHGSLTARLNISKVCALFFPGICPYSWPQKAGTGKIKTKVVSGT
jgi:hypothetical protein